VKLLLARLLSLLALALVLFASSTAHANEEPVASPPRDVPLVLPSATLSVPPLPPTYQQRDLGWMTIAYPPSVHERVRPLIEEAPAYRALLADELGQSVLDHVEVRIARSADDMAAMAPREVPPPAYASGVAYPAHHLVLLSLTAPAGGDAVPLDEVFRHELFHVALEDAVKGHHVPLWFNEGMAIHASDEHRLTRVHTLWDATLSRSVIPLSDLDRSFPNQNYEASIAYAESADVVRFLLRNPDRLRFSALIERVRGGQPFDRALADAYDTDLRKLEFQWREDIAKRYTFAPVLASGMTVWVFTLAILVVGYVRKRRRDRETLARWEEEERDTVAPERSPQSELPGIPADIHPRGLPKIEHEGGWHTLH
jgi:Peptidase MA superfamily